MMMLQQANRPALALSRHPRPAAQGITWLHGSLQAMPAIPETVDTLISVGPLDAFADWLHDTGGNFARVVAISSTGRNDKAHSPDAGERALAGRLRQAEASLLQIGRERGIAVTVLRPTLLYGSGQDQSLSRLVAFARRWKFLALPSSATGLRQPVHVGDVADAILRCLDAPASAGQGFDLPGGETLPFRDMVRRTLDQHAPGTPLLAIPAALFRMATWVARPVIGPVGRGMLARLERDQVADASAAHGAFGYQPRRFDP